MATAQSREAVPQEVSTDLKVRLRSLLAPAASSFTKNYKGATETLKALRKKKAIKQSSQPPSREVQKVLEKTLPNTKSRCWLLSHWNEVVLF